MNFRLPSQFSLKNLRARWQVDGLHEISSRSAAFDDLGARLTEMVDQAPRTAAESLSTTIAEIRQHPGQLRAQLHALEQTYTYACTLIGGMERVLDESPLPMSATARSAAATADRLIKQLSEAYISLSAALDAKWMRPVYAKALALATFRAVQLVYRRGLLAHRAYTSGSPRRWAVLRTLASVARKHKFDRKELEVANEDTIENLIIRASMMALSDPATLSSTELGWLRFYVDRHAYKGILRDSAPEQHSSGLFILSDSGQGPQRLQAGQALEPHVLVIDLRHVLKKLKRQLGGLRRGLPTSRLGLQMSASEPSYMFMLQRASEQWSEPRMRRQNRDTAKPSADLISGYDAARHFISALAFRRNSEDPAIGLKTALSQASEWTILDQSPSGYGLRFAQGSPSKVAIGEVVALRPRESGTVQMCVARRARAVSELEFELGLELLGDGALPVTINKPQLKGNALPVPALLLPKVPALNNSPALLAPIGDVKKGMSLFIPYKGKPVRLEVVEVIETMATCQLLRLRALRSDTGRGVAAAEQTPTPPAAHSEILDTQET